MDFTKTCWYCHKDTMQATNQHYTCSECGATWNEVCKLGGLTVEEEPRGDGTTKYTPARKMIGVAAKIREKEEEDATDI